MHILQKKSFTTSLRRRKTFKDFKRRYPIIFEKYRCFDVNYNNRKPRACKITKADESDPSSSATVKTKTKRARSASKSSANTQILKDDENEVAVKGRRGRKPQTPTDVEMEVVPTAVKRTRGRKPQTKSDVENEVVSTVVKRTKSGSKKKQETPISIPNIELATEQEIEPKDTKIVKRSTRSRGAQSPETLLELPAKTRKRCTTPRSVKGKSKNEISQENEELLTTEYSNQPIVEYTDENQYDIKNIESAVETPQRKTRKKATTPRVTKSKKKADTLIDTSELVTTEQNIQSCVENVNENLFGIENVKDPEYSVENVDESQQICPVEGRSSNVSVYFDAETNLEELTDESYFPHEQQEVIDEDNLGPNVFDQTLYCTGNVPQEEEYIPEDRDWGADINPNFQVNEALEKQPVKSCLKRSAPKPQSHALRSYKFFNDDDELKVIVDGVSHSTYIKRIITYLKSVKVSFEMEMVQLVMPGINLEARLLGNLQMISDMFREELIPMLIYSLHEKNTNMYHRVLMEQFRDTINFFMNLRVTNGNFYEFEQRREIFFFTDDPEYNSQFVNSLPRTSYSIFSESFYSFNALLLYGVFINRIHYTVLQQMFRSFSKVLQKAAIKAMETN